MASDRSSIRERFLTTQTDTTSVINKLDEKFNNLSSLKPPERKVSLGSSQIPKPVKVNVAETVKFGTLPKSLNRQYSGYTDRTVETHKRKNYKSESSASSENLAGVRSFGSASSIYTKSSSNVEISKGASMIQRDYLATTASSSRLSPFPVRKTSIQERTVIRTNLTELPGVLDIEYNMKHGRRGKAVIFSHRKYDDEEEMTRSGAQLDVDNLKTALPRLGFLPTDIIVHEDLTFSEIKSVLEELRSDSHVNRDCLLVIVLTHGKEGEQLHARDTTYATDKIWKPFQGDTCKGLRGKPKIFIIVACRGRFADPGTTIERQKRRPSTTATDSLPTTRTLATYTIPVQADFLTVYSTQPLHYSFREEDRGTWYIEAFCRVLRNLPPGVKFNFTEFLTQVHLLVGVTYEAYDQESEYHKKRQCPSYTSTLTRTIFITPTDIGIN